jgi:uncharacterized membrane protein YkvA (DUF1232 family)
MIRLAGTVARLPRYLNLAQALARDPAVPRRQKAILGAAIGYAILPVDLIPGIIPVVGQLDDLAALLLGLRRALAGCPPDLSRAHLDRVGLSAMALDADLETVRLTAIWLARGGVALGRRVLSVPLRLLARRADAVSARA